MWISLTLMVWIYLRIINFFVFQLSEAKEMKKKKFQHGKEKEHHILKSISDANKHFIAEITIWLQNKNQKRNRQPCDYVLYPNKQ